MDKRGAVRARAKVSDAFSGVPDELLLQILVNAASPFTPNSFVAGYAYLNELCKLRPVCRRFDRLVPGAERLLCDYARDHPKLLPFVLESKALKAFALEYTCHNDLVIDCTMLLQALLIAAPLLTSLTVEHAYSYEHANNFWNFVRCIAACPKLDVLAVKHCELPGQGTPSSTRFKRTFLTDICLASVELDDNACLPMIIKVCPDLKTLSLFEVSCPSGKILIESLNLRTLTAQVGTVLEVEAPNLLYMETGGFKQIFINAPNLATLSLELDYPQKVDVIKRADWKVATLMMKQVPTNLEDWFQVVGLCGDAKVVSICNASSKFEGASFIDGAAPSLFHQFKQIEELRLPFDLLECLGLETGASTAVLPLGNLKRLELGFEKKTEPIQLCHLFLAALQSLVTLTLDLKMLSKKRFVVGGFVGNVLHLQRAYPNVRISVQWPHFGKAYFDDSGSDSGSEYSD